MALRAHIWKVGSTWSKSFKCYIIEEFWRTWIVQTKDWGFIYHCSLIRDWCLWTGDSLLKLKIAPEEQCKFYALLAIYIYMWDQVLTLVVVLYDIKGLALEVEQKSFVYSLCLFLILLRIVIWSSTFSFWPSRPIREELRLLMWTYCRIVNMGALAIGEVWVHLRLRRSQVCKALKFCTTTITWTYRDYDTSTLK